MPNYELSTWYTMWAIAGTPKPIVDRMHAEVTKRLTQPEMRELWAKQGAEPGGDVAS